MSRGPEAAATRFHREAGHLSRAPDYPRAHTITHLSLGAGTQPHDTSPVAAKAVFLAVEGSRSPHLAGPKKIM